MTRIQPTTSDDLPVRDSAQIVRLGHIEYRVTDLERARHFYVDLLGFHETERDQDRIYLRAIEDREHHTVTLHKAPSPGVGHIGFKVAGPDALDRLERRFRRLGLLVQWLQPEQERGQSRALRVRDPFGFPIEYYCDILAGAGLADAIERGPARHGISNALFVYVRDPDGNRMELYTGDYLTGDPDFKTIRWKLDDPRRQTLWGPPPPRRWFEEYVQVESLETGELVEVTAQVPRAIPSYVD